jgi:hypothetical protein
MNRIKLNYDELSWQPAHEVWPGYRLQDLDTTTSPSSGPGVFVKVLRRPGDGGGCWCALLRFTPPRKHAIHVTAVAASDEEVFILSDSSSHSRSGIFTCNPEGLRHGNTFAADTVAYVHYHGEPDQILKAELVEPADIAG